MQACTALKPRLQHGRMSASFACDELPKLNSGRAPHRAGAKRARFFLRGLAAARARRRKGGAKQVMSSSAAAARSHERVLCMGRAAQA